MSARKKEMRSTIVAAESPLLHWILTIGLALFIIIFPYNKALFNGYEYSFESAIYSAAIYGFVLLAATAIYVYRVGWKLNNHRSILSILVLLLPVVYWLSSMQAVSSYYAGFMVKVMFLMAALFLTAIYAGERLPARKIVEYATMLTCYIVVFYGLLILFGQEYFRDGMWLAHDGYRLASVFQYSNTYAGFLSAILLAAVYYAATCTRWYMRLANAIMLVPIFISFLLTYSRGAIVIIPVVILIIVPFLRFAQQIAYIVYAGLTALLSVVILGKLTANTDAIAAIVQPTETKAPSPISMFDSLPFQSWLLLGVAALVNAGLILLIHKKLYPWLETKTKKLAERKWSFAAVPATIIVIGSLAVVILLTSSGVRDLLPDKIAARFETINLQQHSVLERWTFYEDGVKVSKDYPILGAGGGGWQALYEQYQHNPYWSRQAHSYFIQTLVEVGWLGLLLLIGLLSYIYWLYIRSYIRYPERRGSHFIFFIISLTLLLHSAIDFDMSYIYLSAVVFISLGSMIAPYGRLLLIQRLTERKPVPYSKIIYSSTLGLLAVFMLIFAARNVSTLSTFDQTMDNASTGKMSIGDVLPALNSVIKKSPNQSAYSLTKYEVLKQAFDQTQDRKYLEEGIATLQDAKKHDPYNRSILLMLNDAFQKDGNLSEQLAILDEGVSKFQWDIQFYEKAVNANIGAMTSDAANKDKYRERVLELEAEVQRRTAQLATLPPEQMQGRSFSFTPETVQAIENLK
ncbi:O-antigen ligase family protein [Paenibacillus radicis (ex Gao et al. 2016)]|uniref:O-antigen polymerase n=1 Tax=Paenibacillus radicis (ex Gao et al. 2016) TaxID=1737354 RepID=A0A917H0B4_9BACL|nr:O-antigen ligase family protein [Paenibacillus radicis (ex Gao et al. 2016)]GGG63292.1 O-antigen polymerase [Paenibacillus radicis (ex Gao et al. 2016)]